MSDCRCPGCGISLDVFVKASELSKEKKVRVKTSVQVVVETYKSVKGVAIDDKGWDRQNFGRYSKAAKSLLDCFGGDCSKASEYVIKQGRAMDSKGFDWTLETMARHAWDGFGGEKEVSGYMRAEDHLLLEGSGD